MNRTINLLLKVKVTHCWCQIQHWKLWCNLQTECNWLV